MLWNRILSSAVYSVYLIAAFLLDKKLWPLASIALLLPLGCIWFGEELGGYIGPAGNAYISRTTPGVFVQILGWLFLLMPAAILFLWH